MRLRIPALALTFLLLSMPLVADEKDTDFDHATDFGKFKTFMIRQGQIAAKAPELNSPLVRKKIEDSIRSQLLAKGLREVQSRPDLAVNYRFGSADRRQKEGFPVGRWGRVRRVETFRFTEGTLVVNLMDTEGRDLVWQGIYRDDESSPAKVSNRLPDDIKKLFSDFPPKKKK